MYTEEQLEEMMIQDIEENCVDGNDIPDMLDEIYSLQCKLQRVEEERDEFEGIVKDALSYINSNIEDNAGEGTLFVGDIKELYDILIR